MKDVIMVIQIDKRSTAAPAVQEVLTHYGDIIHFRLGIHDLHHGDALENGRILLQATGEDAQVDALARELQALELVRVQTMELE